MCDAPAAAAAGRADEADAQEPAGLREVGNRRARVRCGRLLTSVGAIWANTVTLTGERLPGAVARRAVTSNFFDVLGATAAYGRVFTCTDEEPGVEPAILLSWGLLAPLWCRSLAGGTPGSTWRAHYRRRRDAREVPSLVSP